MRTRFITAPLAAAAVFALALSASGCNKKVEECNKLIQVMNSEGAKLSPKGSATDPSTMTKMGDDLDTAAKAIGDVDVSLPELQKFRDDSKKLFTDVATAARESGKALEGKDLAAATTALKKLTDSAQANTKLVNDINKFCQGQ
jgi:flagellin-like hook-associated protein FlgL